MRCAIWILTTGLTAAVSLAAEPPALLGPPLAVTAEIYPSHSLPALNPAVHLELSNPGRSPVTLAARMLRLEVSNSDGVSFSIDCSDRIAVGPGGEISRLHFCPGDWGGPSFDGKSSLTIPAGSAVDLLLTPFDNGFFNDRRFLPGRYDLRFVLDQNGINVAANVVRYTVDKPSAENGLVWAVLQHEPEDEPFTYSGHEIRAALAAHPSSDYAKIWSTFYLAHYEQDPDRGGTLQRLLASGLLPPFDDVALLKLAAFHHEKALEAAVAGDLRSVGQEVDEGRSIAEGLLRAPDFYARLSAQMLLDGRPWTREELKRRGDSIAGRGQVEYQAIRVWVDCITRNGDGTYTAWFGYTNPDSGTRDLAVGAQNQLIGLPDGGKQPITFHVGRHSRAFSVTLREHEKATWKVDDSEVTASADDAAKYDCVGASQPNQ